jgi:hypothetical protein
VPEALVLKRAFAPTERTRFVSGLALVAVFTVRVAEAEVAVPAVLLTTTL